MKWRCTRNTTCKIENSSFYIKMKKVIKIRNFMFSDIFHVTVQFYQMCASHHAVQVWSWFCYSQPFGSSSTCPAANRVGRLRIHGQVQGIVFNHWGAHRGLAEVPGPEAAGLLLVGGRLRSPQQDAGFCIKHQPMLAPHHLCVTQHAHILRFYHSMLQHISAMQLGHQPSTGFHPTILCFTLNFNFPQHLSHISIGGRQRRPDPLRTSPWGVGQPSSQRFSEACSVAIMPHLARHEAPVAASNG